MLLLLNKAIILCLAIVVAAIAAKECIAKDIIGMVTPLALAINCLFFVCGVAVGVAPTMVEVSLKPKPEPERKPTTKKTTIVVYVYPTGRCYHSLKCISSQPEKNDLLHKPTEITLTEAKQRKKVECGCRECIKYFRSST